MPNFGCFFRVLGYVLMGIGIYGVLDGIPKGDPIVVGMSVVVFIIGLAAALGGAGATQIKQQLH